ncbi:MAG TPA: Spy/CpxP family protein refolding chaperone [Armatimonadota bacterium]|nr:Spy/CpxP family protein refolding chaperone [Armatimonadota bacterium]
MIRNKTLIFLVVSVALCVGQVVMAAAPKGTGPARGELLQTLNLTADQKTKAQEIFQQERQQMQKVLTPEQQQAMKERATVARSMAKTLNLTADQKTKLQAIRNDVQAKAQAITGNAKLSDAEKKAQFAALRKAARAQFQQVLTPEQQAQVKDAMAQAKQDKGLKAPTLSKDQRAQLQTIREKTMTEFRAILTPEQQQKFDQFRASHKEG